VFFQQLVTKGSGTICFDYRKGKPNRYGGGRMGKGTKGSRLVYREYQEVLSTRLPRGGLRNRGDLKQKKSAFTKRIDVYW